MTWKFFFISFEQLFLSLAQLLGSIRSQSASHVFRVCSKPASSSWNSSGNAIEVLEIGSNHRLEIPMAQAFKLVILGKLPGFPGSLGSCLGTQHRSKSFFPRSSACWKSWNSYCSEDKESSIDSTDLGHVVTRLTAAVTEPG